MKKVFYSLFALLTFALTSCDKNDITNNAIEVTEGTQSLKIIRVIRKLENPYSVTNMKKAYAALQQEGLMKAPLDIQATHLYVRFMPKSDAEYEILSKDTLLTLFNHPLDCELTEGEYYLDSTLKNNNLQWFYTKVPVGYVSPIQGYEVLDELYLPTDTISCTTQTITNQQVKNYSSAATYWTLLENRALTITDNAKTSPAKVNNGQQRATTSWTPTATIRVQDENQFKFIGLAGIKVHARNWFNWRSGVTGSDGKATMSGKFSSQQIDWSFDWQGKDFNILQGEWMLQAGYSKTLKGDWALDISRGCMSYCYAHAYRACNIYWNNPLGLKTPFSISFWRQKINVGVFDGVGRSKTFTVGWVLGSRVKIYRYNDESGVKIERSARELFEVTIHELNHISYWELNPKLTGKTENRQLIESWAKGVEYSFSSLYYPQSTGEDAFQCVRYNHLMSPNWGYDNGIYTPIIIDLIDDFNQDAEYPNYDMVDDKVSGYTIGEIEKAIKNTGTLTVLKQNLIALYDNPTEQYLDDLFTFYTIK